MDRLEARLMLAVTSPPFHPTAASEAVEPAVASSWLPADPGAPRDVVATAGDGFVNLMWRQPTYMGAAPIRNYRIFMSEDGGMTWTKVTRPPSPDLSASVTGLTNGKSYSFRLQASNGSLGTFSDPVSVVPRSSLVRSASPFNLVVQASDGRVTLSWSPPNAGSGRIINYVIRSMAEGGSWVRVVRPLSTDLAATIGGLANGTRYRFKVNAVTTNGPTSPSAASVYVRPATVPGTPTELVAHGSGGDRMGPGQVVLTWRAPGDGGCEIIDYTISWTTTTAVGGGINGGSVYRFGRGSEVVRVEPGATASATLAILGTNTRYTFYVAARNEVGIGENSAASNSVYFGDTPFPVDTSSPLPRLPVTS